jgi:hypothetical protein
MGHLPARVLHSVRILLACRARADAAALGNPARRRSVFSLLLGLVQLGQSIARSFRDPQFRALLLLYGGLLVVGTAFYVRTEGWSALDALYFSRRDLATVGYGDSLRARHSGRCSPLCTY